MENFNWWRLLPWEAISLAALVLLALVLAEPGQRRWWLTQALAVWGMLLFGFISTAFFMGWGGLG